MARLLLVLALCVLPALVTAGRPSKNPFEVVGRVFCDPCRCGFETPKTSYIAGAKVRVECRDRKSLNLVYSKEAKTDSTGTYKLLVDEDHKDQLCDALVVSSPRHDCKAPSSGRDRARVILTGYNGIASNNRYANAIGFEKAVPESGCTELLMSYLESDDN